MNQNEFNRMVKRVPALSPEQMELLRRELESRMAETASVHDMLAHGEPNSYRRGTAQNPDDLTEAERADQDLQRGLFEAGLLSEIKPPLRNLTPYHDRKAISDSR